MELSAASGWQRFWTVGRWWKAVLVVVVYLALYQLSGLAVGGLFGQDVDAENVFATPASVFFSIAAPLIVGAVILLVFLGSVGWIKPMFARQPVAGHWWMWIFVLLVVAPIGLRLAGIDYASYASGVVATTFAAGLLIGFVEELLYRGIVIKILRSGGHRELVVAVISSGLFALSHSLNLLSGQSVATVGATVLMTFGFGMMMYLVLRVTGNIIWPMLVHALTDPTTFLATGGIDETHAAGHSPLLDLAAPFNFLFVAAALVAVFLIRGRAKVAA